MKKNIFLLVMCLMALQSYSQTMKATIIMRDSFVYTGDLINMNSNGVTCIINGTKTSFPAEKICEVQLENGQVKHYNTIYAKQTNSSAQTAPNGSPKETKPKADKQEPKDAVAAKQSQEKKQSESHNQATDAPSTMASDKESATSQETSLKKEDFAHHQLGGDLGIGVQATIVNGSSNNESMLNFNIEPQYIYAINNKYEVGVSLTLATWQIIAPSNRESNFVWAVNPIARFHIIGNEKIGFWIETKATLGMSTDRKHTDTEIKGNGVNLQWGVNINPVLTYQISKHFRMETTFGFLGVGLNGYTYLDGGEAKYTTIDFGTHISNGSLTTVIEHTGLITDHIMNKKGYAQGRFLAKMVDFQIGFAYTF